MLKDLRPVTEPGGGRRDGPGLHAQTLGCNRSKVRNASRRRRRQPHGSDAEEKTAIHPAAQALRRLPPVRSRAQDLRLGRGSRSVQGGGASHFRPGRRDRAGRHRRLHGPPDPLTRKRFRPVSSQGCIRAIDRSRPQPFGADRWQVWAVPTSRAVREIVLMIVIQGVLSKMGNAMSNWIVTVFEICQ